MVKPIPGYASYPVGSSVSVATRRGDLATVDASYFEESGGLKGGEDAGGWGCIGYRVPD